MRHRHTSHLEAPVGTKPLGHALYLFSKQPCRLLIDLAELGLPTSTEALDPVTPQYLQDLIAWSALAARTTESQTHR